MRLHQLHLCQLCRRHLEVAKVVQIHDGVASAAFAYQVTAPCASASCVAAPCDQERWADLRLSERWQCLADQYAATCAPSAAPLPPAHTAGRADMRRRCAEHLLLLPSATELSLSLFQNKLRER